MQSLYDSKNLCASGSRFSNKFSNKPGKMTRNSATRDKPSKSKKLSRPLQYKALDGIRGYEWVRPKTPPGRLVRMRSPVRIRAAAPKSLVFEWKPAIFCFILDFSSVVKNADPLDEMRKQHRLDRIIRSCDCRNAAVFRIRSPAPQRRAPDPYRERSPWRPASRYPSG